MGKQASREELLELIKDMFVQGCAIGDGELDHCCLSVYEEAQELLIDEGLIERERCVRPTRR